MHLLTSFVKSVMESSVPALNLEMCIALSSLSLFHLYPSHESFLSHGNPPYSSSQDQKLRRSPTALTAQLIPQGKECFRNTSWRVSVRSQQNTSCRVSVRSRQNTPWRVSVRSQQNTPSRGSVRGLLSGALLGKINVSGRIKRLFFPTSYI
ncbi:unnamed protein product [Cuscuta europaea]|uniref:Uncharacterized protein n=1 Tax=Cuscuta europaea TaxID=41803 RepID=A0A9P0ZR48_CUSEU|nr:unnamed protein product [Cuscuta europaea]